MGSGSVGIEGGPPRFAAGKSCKGGSGQYAAEQVPSRAWIDSVPALVALRLVGVGDRERQLLARGAELAGGAVEGDQAGVLQEAAEAAGARQVAAGAGVPDLPAGGRGGGCDQRLHRRQGKRGDQ